MKFHESEYSDVPCHYLLCRGIRARPSFWRCTHHGGVALTFQSRKAVRSCTCTLSLGFLDQGLQFPSGSRERLHIDWWDGCLENTISLGTWCRCYRSTNITVNNRRGVLQADLHRLKNEGHTVLVLREIELPQNHNSVISEIALNGFIRRMTRVGRVMH